MTTYKLLYGAAWFCLLGILFCGGVTAIGPADLGLPSHAAAWVALFGLIFGGVQSFLPPIQRFPTSVDNAGPRSDPDPLPRDR
jgi:hypothetical protein